MSEDDTLHPKSDLKVSQEAVPGAVNTYPVLPLRDIVVFPQMVVPLFVGRERSVRALEEVVARDCPVFLVTQKDSGSDDPTPEELYSVGTVATILQLLKLPDGTVKVLVEGVARARIRQYTRTDDFYDAELETLIETTGDLVESDALCRSILAEFDSYAKLSKQLSTEIVASVKRVTDPSEFSDKVASHLALKIPHKQELLETTVVAQRLEKVLAFIENETSVLAVEKRIRTRVKRQMEKTQREYYLNEQLKAIQKELGDDDGRNEIRELEEKVSALKLSKEAKEKATAELRKLRQMSPMSAEATVVRNYLDWVLNIPWGVCSRSKSSLSAARKVLDSDHYGLEKVKERVVEYIAVQKRTSKIAGPILCLVGPPGVGKTSLGRSIARATGREFVRLSLGGVRDEAEIRGHRRTYIGSMPGKIIQAMRKAKTVNPLILLDEVDKMGMDFRGDPSSALLEVLDPQQNKSFNDHYLEIDYDLSQVMFVTTANTLDIPSPLLDRMELIRLSGYTEEEKLAIAREHLVASSLSKHGLTPQEWSIDDDALLSLIRVYTREAGVRNLEREIANLIRKAVKAIVNKDVTSVHVTSKNLSVYLGAPKYRYGEIEEKDWVGCVTGLAWTEVGGELLTVEGVMMPGRGKMIVTGNLRDVMKESISAAASYVRSRAHAFGIHDGLFDKKDVHVHLPEGATPKDGPSAGIAIATAVISLMTGIPVHRDVAMTGEVTLRGRVLPIGGLKEKLLAALRGGIKTVLIPKDNERDLDDLPQSVKKMLIIIPVSHMDEVLEHALTQPLESLPAIDPLGITVEKSPLLPILPDDDTHGFVAH